MWVRGLKLLLPLPLCRFIMSHPVWVRGLKLLLEFAVSYIRVSHPVWVRGLKQCKRIIFAKWPLVAPRVGAWIETKAATDINADVVVAPRVGAWIETDVVANELAQMRSHPVWVRGLKRIWLRQTDPLVRRTPCGCVD